MSGKKMKIFAISFLFLANCGNSGIDIEANGNKINKELFQFAFDFNDANFSFKLNKDFHFYEAAQANGLSVEFVDHDLYDGKTKVRGLTIDHNIYVHISKNSSNPVMKCVDMYYVLSHELLHYGCNVGMYSCTAKQNHDHDIPYVFIQWAQDNNMGWNTTVEYWTYWNFREVCQQELGE